MKLTLRLQRVMPIVLNRRAEKQLQTNTRGHWLVVSLSIRYRFDGQLVSKVRWTVKGHLNASGYIQILRACRLLFSIHWHRSQFVASCRLRNSTFTSMCPETVSYRYNEGSHSMPLIIVFILLAVALLEHSFWWRWFWGMGEFISRKCSNVIWK